MRCIPKVNHPGFTYFSVLSVILSFISVMAWPLMPFTWLYTDRGRDRSIAYIDSTNTCIVCMIAV